MARARTYTNRFTLEDAQINGVPVSIDFDRTVAVKDFGGPGRGEPGYTETLADDVNEASIVLDAGYNAPGRKPTAEELPLVLAALKAHIETVPFEPRHAEPEPWWDYRY